MSIYLAYFISNSVVALAARKIAMGFWGTMLTVGANAYMLVHYTPFFAAFTVWNVLYFFMLSWTVIASAYNAIHDETESVFDKRPNPILVFVIKVIVLGLCTAFYYKGGAFNV